MGFGVCGLAIIVLSVIWLLKQKPTYCVVLSTSGGEVRAIQTSDWPFIERIVTALNEAIMSHT